ncbi:MAG: hypothetical protein IPI43_11495 [Sandaracinaceae bacterium]|nr:hypothetical protein [Sandaracinaceae bacterium]
MLRDRTTLLLVAVLPAMLAGGCASAPSSPGEDLRGLLRFVQATHPRPYAYVSRAELEALAEAEAQRLDALDAPDDFTVGLAFHRVLARLGDGHVAVALPVFQDDVASALTLLPLLPKLAGETFFVDACSTELPRGTRLIAIDGEPIEALWAELEALVLADGVHESARRAALERGFARHYHLLRGMRASYRVDVELPDGEAQTLTLAGVPRDALGPLSRARHSAPVWGPVSPEEPPWPFVVDVADGTVLLRLPSFGIADQEAYRVRVDALFAQIDPDDTLILDLRGNEGGLRTHGVAVLNHVLGAPYAQWASLSARVLRVPSAFRSLTTFPFVPEEHLAALLAGAERDGELWVRTGDPLASLMVPHGEGHRGRVVAFIDGHTNSAAVELVTALRAWRPDAELHGEPTGGECGRHVGEVPVVYTTPHRGVSVLMSLLELRHVATPGCVDGQGHAPDLAVVYDEAAFLAGVDPYLEGLESPTSGRTTPQSPPAE